MPDWLQRQSELVDLARGKTLFFVGGAPRSGTTWLQQILDAHPDVRCRGEGLFMTQFANPLQGLMDQRSKVLAEKNTHLFAHTGGYPLPTEDDVEHLVGAAILLGLARQSEGGDYAAIGEKTPENVFFFPRLRQLFPAAKFFAIARDPRDVLTSAWHFFHKASAGEDENAAKLAFIQSALPSLGQGARATIAFARDHPTDLMTLTYEELRRDPAPIVARLFRHLGAADAPEIVSACIARTTFVAQSGGRAAGEEHRGSFFRKGVAGDWTSTFSPEMGELIVRELGWMFPHFGWRA